MHVLSTTSKASLPESVQESAREAFGECDALLNALLDFLTQLTPEIQDWIGAALYQIQNWDAAICAIEQAGSYLRRERLQQRAYLRAQDLCGRVTIEDSLKIAADVEAIHEVDSNIFVSPRDVFITRIPDLAKAFVVWDFKRPAPLVQAFVCLTDLDKQLQPQQKNGRSSSALAIARLIHDFKFWGYVWSMKQWAEADMRIAATLLGIEWGYDLTAYERKLRGG
ncbi:hypothetical protein A3D60_03065 [Candidatus Uhrbacteria bacterium RIFCSPHIGHO2_02_FULL_47_29]|uniref:Uncharacterized protein n=1 Tax=Candidatus Uhrbacteria bacterium RIFCSPLOWO2_01_FULL_47_25 TaxID=1802402 RepID=A0A1F7UX67_9BACT|nr:MAG: hypothetical protein UX68_C0037G0004 [Parcubacteria group bacterium GW2011_GWA2_46_9]OGL59876.1 MAG: hypothetical protein A2752_03995 [Candidatus Uhrbacteria bacterium RIFCSPHIGHO2_01_FULL_46_23]OGL69427.1 MAG: hypothetical protein A3D60_03065 [Candidatus Uhrbacteria bacterium RIFCSPHIGHO2_02_FULL_47_29]OGL82880.1 MAG: hypothetical protein A2936_04075 [Candidatus Uhrbacteria bacterium RIFCSPLOWO2_01_FULL_47_25]OGL84717.1 MAG: hypothetical protein A3I37_01130 [Candidatus Uhrbacteria bact